MAETEDYAKIQARNFQNSAPKIGLYNQSLEKPLLGFKSFASLR